MSSRAFRSSAIGVTYIARQFGIQVNADSVEDAIARGTLSTAKDFDHYFFEQGILTKIRKFKPEELLEKKYIYPCIGIMKDGRSYILAGTDLKGSDGKPEVVVIDPMDPTAKAERHLLT